MIKVYIASPYTIGNQEENVKRQITCANELMDCGFVPFLPLLSHYQHIVHERPYEDWLKNDFEWLKVCDCLLRLSGKSKGADMEVEEMKRLGKPVFYSTQSIIDYYGMINTYETHN